MLHLCFKLPSNPFNLKFLLNELKILNISCRQSISCLDFGIDIFNQPQIPDLPGSILVANKLIKIWTQLSAGQIQSKVKRALETGQVIRLQSKGQILFLTPMEDGQVRFTREVGNSCQ